MYTYTCNATGLHLLSYIACMLLSAKLAILFVCMLRSLTAAGVVVLYSLDILNVTNVPLEDVTVELEVHRLPVSRPKSTRSRHHLIGPAESVVIGSDYNYNHQGSKVTQHNSNDGKQRGHAVADDAVGSGGFTNTFFIGVEDAVIKGEVEVLSEWSFSFPVINENCKRYCSFAVQVPSIQAVCISFCLCFPSRNSFGAPDFSPKSAGAFEASSPLQHAHEHRSFGHHMSGPHSHTNHYHNGHLGMHGNGSINSEGFGHRKPQAFDDEHTAMAEAHRLVLQCGLKKSESDLTASVLDNSNVYVPTASIAIPLSAFVLPYFGLGLWLELPEKASIYRLLTSGYDGVSQLVRHIGSADAKREQNAPEAFSEYSQLLDHVVTIDLDAGRNWNPNALHKVIVTETTGQSL